jgi:outer membrane protein OmpA-like peptidoglycan-associated protein/5-hydroxyisourate hydrolase-like protein (transthyretin family)
VVLVLLLALGLGVTATQAAAATGTISGTVTAATGEGELSGINVLLYVLNGSTWDFDLSAETDAEGDYSIGGLAAGTYRAYFYDVAGTYIREYYAGSYTADGATSIPVADGATVAGIDATLDTAGHITGTVYEPDGTTPREAIEVRVLPVSEAATSTNYYYAITDVDGWYDIAGLPSGQYRVQFLDVVSLIYSPQYYIAGFQAADAVPVLVTAPGTTVGIDATLSVGGTISGTVTDGVNPIAGVSVIAYQNVVGEEYEWISQTFTTLADGSYVIQGLPTGSFVVSFDAPGYAFTFYDGAYRLQDGTTVPVTVGNETTGIDAELSLPGTISGTITAAAGGGPLAGEWAEAYRETSPGVWDFIVTGVSEVDGTYTTGPIPPGTYRVKFGASSAMYKAEYFDGVFSDTEATPIVVGPGDALVEIDATLDPLNGHINGTVTVDGGGPAAGVEVTAWRPDGTDWVWASTTNTAADGSYSVGGLPAGIYRVLFTDNNGVYISEYYNDALTIDDGTSIVLGSGATEFGIDASLATAGHVTGTVTAATGGAPLPNIWVQVFHMVDATTYDWVTGGYTAANGTYDVGGLPTGTYRVGFYPSTTAYVAEYYIDAFTVETATDISVTAPGTTGNIDAALDTGGNITGTVTASFDGAGLQNIRVDAYLLRGGDWVWAGGNTTEEGGTYDVYPIPAGTYRVSFTDDGGTFATQYYQAASSLGTATNVALSEGGTTTNINAVMMEFGGLQGTVQGPGGPLEGVTVSLSGGAGVATTTADGTYTISGIAPGTYTATFSLTGYVTQAPIVDITEGATITQDITLVAADTSMPTTATVTTPSDGSAYYPGTMPTAFSGQAADDPSGAGLNADSTTFRLQRSSDSYYWNGLDWQAAPLDLATTQAATTGGTSVTWTHTAGLPNWALQTAGTYTARATATNKDSNTYSGAAITFTLAVLKDVTVTATGSNKVYDGTAAASVTVTSTDFAPGDSVTAAYTSATFDDKIVGNGKHISVTGITLSGPDAGKYNLLNTTASTTANITPKPVTGSFTSANKIYDGTTDASATARSVAGTVTGEVVTLTGGTAAFADKNVGTDKTVTLTGAVLGGDDADNYTLSATPITTTADITEKPITVTAVTDTKTYDGTRSSVGVPTSDPLVAGDTGTWTQTFDTADVGSDKTLTPAGTVSDGDADMTANYDITFTPVDTGEITRATVTVTADDKTKVFGAPDPALTFSATGFVSDDTWETLPTGSIADPHLNIGTYTITFSGGDAGTNYTIAYVDGTLTVVADRPGPPSSVTYGPVTGGTLIRWGASAGATGYQVWAGTRLLGTTGPGTRSLFVAEVLGPNAGIKVVALGSEGAASEPGQGAYTAGTSAKLGAVRFTANSPKLTPATKRALRSYAKIIAAQGFTRIGVNGYTATYSDRGTWAFRKRLSVARAKNVKAYLASQFRGLHVSVAISTTGYGNRYPVASNRTASGRAKNRRAEILLK